MKLLINKPFQAAIRTTVKLANKNAESRLSSTHEMLLQIHDVTSSLTLTQLTFVIDQVTEFKLKKAIHKLITLQTQHIEALQ